MNSLGKKILGIVIFGLLWGCVEIFLGEYLFSGEIPLASAILSIFSLALLFFSRRIIGFPHTGFLIGIIAAVMKTGVLGPSNHIWAIILFGLYFDLFYDLFKEERIGYLGNAASIFSIFLLVTLSMALLRIGTWNDEFLKKLFTYTIVNGIPASLIGAIFASMRK